MSWGDIIPTDSAAEPKKKAGKAAAPVPPPKVVQEAKPVTAPPKPADTPKPPKAPAAPAAPKPPVDAAPPPPPPPPPASGPLDLSTTDVVTPPLSTFDLLTRLNKDDRDRAVYREAAATKALNTERASTNAAAEQHDLSGASMTVGPATPRAPALRTASGELSDAQAANQASRDLVKSLPDYIKELHGGDFDKSTAALMRARKIQRERNPEEFADMEAAFTQEYLSLKSSGVGSAKQAARDYATEAAMKGFIVDADAARTMRTLENIGDLKAKSRQADRDFIGNYTSYPHIAARDEARLDALSASSALPSTPVPTVEPKPVPQSPPAMDWLSRLARATGTADPLVQGQQVNPNSVTTDDIRRRAINLLTQRAALRYDVEAVRDSPDSLGASRAEISELIAATQRRRREDMVARTQSGKLP